MGQYALDDRALLPRNDFLQAMPDPLRDGGAILLGQRATDRKKPIALRFAPAKHFRVIG